jgi:hypothetical protein
MLMQMGLRGPAGLGLAVCLSALLSYPPRLRPAHIVAAFTALLVLITGDPVPGPSYAHRLGAVLLGAGSATLFNLLASALQYRTLFQRRIGLVRMATATALYSGDRPSYDRADALLRDLSGELQDVAREQRRSDPTRHHLEQVEVMREILSVAWVQRYAATPEDLREVASCLDLGGSLPSTRQGALASLLARWHDAAADTSGHVVSAADLVPRGWVTLG